MTNDEETRRHGRRARGCANFWYPFKNSRPATERRQNRRDEKFLPDSPHKRADLGKGARNSQ